MFILAEIGNCIVRENPPFSPVHVKTTDLNKGYKSRGCVTNDNTEYEIHMIGIYGDGYDPLLPFVFIIAPSNDLPKRLPESVYKGTFVHQKNFFNKKLTINYQYKK